MIKDPYVYEGISVLVNKLGIRDSEILGKAEKVADQPEIGIFN